MFAYETYRGNGRPTGRISENIELIYGEGSSWQKWDGTEAEFEAFFEAEQHSHCHSPSWSDYRCPHCQAAGWAA